MMNSLIEKFLDAKFEDDLRVEVLKVSHRKTINIFCKNNMIISGNVNDHGSFEYIGWTVHYSLWVEIFKYIPTTEKSIDNDVVTWTRRKCKKQGIPFVGPTLYSLK